MAENFENNPTHDVGEVTIGMEKLELSNSPDEKDSEDSTVLPAAIGADEAKDSDFQPSESPVKGRIFVGGISWRTTDRDLRDYFGKFGDIKDCLVCKDQWTGKSRGFGFLSFEDPKVAESLISKTHTIGGRTVQVKTAVAKSNNVRTKSEVPRIPAGQNRTKLFVGGLHRGVNNKEFRAYFEAYGKLTDAFIMYNMQSKRSRGFGFVTFVSRESAHKCLRERHTIRGKAVEIKVAIPREVIGSPRDKRNMRGHQQQQYPQQHKYDGWNTNMHDGGWNNDMHATAAGVPYGHMVPGGGPMMGPPMVPAPGASVLAPPMVPPQQPSRAAAVNPHAGPYDQWMPSVMGIGGRPAASMGAGMYSQDLYYGAVPPAHNMATNPYGYGYRMPMYNPYPEAPLRYERAAPMYNPVPRFGMPPPSVSPPRPPVNVAAPPMNTASPPMDPAVPPPADTPYPEENPPYVEEDSTVYEPKTENETE